jgi:hypothetical protein
MYRVIGVRRSTHAGAGPRENFIEWRLYPTHQEAILHREDWKYIFAQGRVPYCSIIRQYICNRM